jgi:hypothetical protein
VWAGVDNAWEQEKLEARKMLLNRADSHTSGARFVSLILSKHLNIRTRFHDIADTQIEIHSMQGSFLTQDVKLDLYSFGQTTCEFQYTLDEKCPAPVKIEQLD